MRLHFESGVPEPILERVRRHSAGTEAMKTRTLKCHYCQHSAIVVYEDSRGHIQARCKKCGEESVYNVVLRRNGTVMFRRVKK
jgi:ribosomal protein S27E